MSDSDSAVLQRSANHQRNIMGANIFEDSDSDANNVPMRSRVSQGHKPPSRRSQKSSDDEAPKHHRLRDKGTSKPRRPRAKIGARRGQDKSNDSGTNEEDCSDNDGEAAQRFFGSEDEEAHNNVQAMLEDCVKWFEDNMTGNTERPWGSDPTVTYDLRKRDKGTVLKVFYRPETNEHTDAGSSDPEEGSSSDDASASRSQKRHSKQSRASKALKKRRKSHQATGFTATFSIKITGRGRSKTAKGEWVVECHVQPAANLKHLLSEKDIKPVVEHAENRSILFEAAKSRGEKIKLLPITHSIRMALPHFIGGGIGRYIYPATLFGGRVTSQPYLDIKFGVKRPQALIGFLSLLTLPNSPVEDTLVHPDELLTPEDMDGGDEDDEDDEDDEEDEDDEDEDDEED
jgi:hypothetical protein